MRLKHSAAYAEMHCFIKTFHFQGLTFICRSVIILKKAVTKRAERQRSQRVGGRCKPMSEPFNSLWLPSRKSEVISRAFREYTLQYAKIIAVNNRRRFQGLIQVREVAASSCRNLSGTAGISRLKALALGRFLLQK